MSDASDHRDMWRVVALKESGDRFVRICDETFDTKREAHDRAERARKQVMRKSSEKPGKIMRDIMQRHCYRVVT